MERAKLFVENFLAYGLINVLNKFIPLLLLPVITRLLSSPAAFGVYDMFHLIIGFGSPLAMLGIYDAMFREYFEKEDQEYSHNVTTTANYLNLVSSFVVSSVLFIFNGPFSKLFFNTPIHGNIVMFSAVALMITNSHTIVSAPTRIENRRKIFVFSGLLTSLSYYVLAVILIYLGYSYLGMIYASIISSTLLLGFFWILNKDYFLKGKFDKDVAKELLKIGIPLVPTFLIYWVYNSMDKIMISNMIGIEEVGIYAIGARIASVGMLIYAAFAGGWQYFSFSTMKEKDQVAINSKVFEYLGAVSFISVFFIYPFVRPVYEFLFTPSYYGGIAVVIYLYLSPLLLMIFQVIQNQFLVIKKSYWISLTLSLGAITNVLLNWFFIPVMGIEGAALATFIGYIVSVIVISVVGIKHQVHIVSRRFILISFITLLYLTIVRLYFFESLVGQFVLSILSVLFFLQIYKEELQLIYSKVKMQLIK